MSKVVELRNGRQASYEVIGEGRPALMLPGGPGFDSRHMRRDAELFADVLQSYLLDPHGSGRSTPPLDPSEYSPAGHAAFYEEVREALGLDEVVVLGWSFGGATALTYSALFPDVVAACVSVAAYCVGPEAEAGRDSAIDEEWERYLVRHADADWYADARAAFDSWTGRILATHDPQEIASITATLMPLYVAHPERPDVMTGLDAMKGYWTPDLACLKECESSIKASFDVRPLLGKIGCPTLVVAGETDFLCGPAQALPIVSGIPGAELEIIPDCGHLLALEEPDAYRAAVVRFLSSLR